MKAFNRYSICMVVTSFMFVQGKLPVVVNTWPWPQATDAGIVLVII